MDVIQFLVDLIFQPGSSLWLVPAINVTVLVLIFMLLIVGFYSDVAKIHVVVMSTLALGLLLSVNWFFHEFQKVQQSQANADAPLTVTNTEENKKVD
eukprot:gene1356-1478_t